MCMYMYVYIYTYIWGWCHYSLAAETTHYGDFIMSAMASQITSLTIVYSTVYLGAAQENIKVLWNWPFAGNSPVTDDFPHKASNAENVSIWWRHHGIWRFYRIDEPILFDELSVADCTDVASGNNFVKIMTAIQYQGPISLTIFPSQFKFDGNYI